MDQRANAQQYLRDAVEYWSKFASRCISRRLDTDRFEEFVRVVYQKHELPANVIAEVFLRPQPDNYVSLDPRIPLYIQILNKLGYIDAPSTINALYKFSRLQSVVKSPVATANTAENRDPDAKGAENHNSSSNEQSTEPDAKNDKVQAISDAERGSNGVTQGSPHWRSSAWFEEFMFYQAIKSIVEGTAFRNTRDALELVHIISKWMVLFSSAANAFAADVLGELQDSNLREEMEVARAAFVPLLLRSVETPALLKALSHPHPLAKRVRKEMSESLASFTQTLPPGSGFAERLELFRTGTLAQMEPVDKKIQAADKAAMDELLETTVGMENFVIPDLPISNTRAGLYVYLNASLVGRPLIDDHALLSFLNNRYQGQAQAATIDLILASFDILANAVFRNEGPKDAHLLKSFLINKVPLLLCQLCPPEASITTSEFCITEALKQVDTSVFPTASLMFDESRSNNPYTESVREEFCTACALHGLILREHVERILGETSMSYEPSLERSSKDKLVEECLANSDKMTSLLREMEKMDGNVGAVSQALAEVIRRLCVNKETMSLKTLCSQLAQKPQYLDILLLFEKLPALLEPLCTLLDNWHYEEDQGEYQPMYEEFGSILLLIMAYTYRYNLTPADIGITSADSSVAKILNRGHQARRQEEMTEQEYGQLGGWIQGLFDTESGGLGDDLMSSCPPQQFYLLVASIFQNVVISYTYGYLNDEALKGGIEYLVDTFLLPSLVPALRFLANYLWVERQEQKAIIKVLQLVLLPSSISGEASTMLSAVRNLIAEPLEHELRVYQRQDPKNQDIEPLLRALKDSVPLSRRTGGADHHELEHWGNSNSSGTGLSGALRHTINSLAQWSMHPSVNSMPTSYTHRQIMAARRIMGAPRTVRLLLEEVRTLSEAGGANVAYDIAGALIGAPDSTNVPPPATHVLDATGNVMPDLQRPQSLPEALAYAAEGARKLHKKDAALAEITVRLHRRVEAQMSFSQPQVMLETQGMQLDLAGAGTADLGDVDAMAAAAAAAAATDPMAVDGVSLDMSLGGTGSAGGLDSTNDGDLFGGLDTNMDMFDWGDGTDLGGTDLGGT